MTSVSPASVAWHPGRAACRVATPARAERRRARAARRRARAARRGPHRACRAHAEPRAGCCGRKPDVAAERTPAERNGRSDARADRFERLGSASAPFRERGVFVDRAFEGPMELGIGHNVPPMCVVPRDGSRRPRRRTGPRTLSLSPYGQSSAGSLAPPARSPRRARADRLDRRVSAPRTSSHPGGAPTPSAPQPDRGHPHDLSRGGAWPESRAIPLRASR